MDVSTTLRRARGAHTRALRGMLRPHLAKSGYNERARDGSRTPTMLWVPRTDSGEPTMKTFALRGGFVVGSFMGFTADGVITDVAGGGLEVTPFSALPVEDLGRLRTWAQKRFADKAL